MSEFKLFTGKYIQLRSERDPAHDANIDLASALEHKLVKNAAKYPVEKSRGSAKKYTEL